jgi:hypothetical protein
LVVEEVEHHNVHQLLIMELIQFLVQLHLLVVVAVELLDHLEALKHQIIPNLGMEQVMMVDQAVVFLI